VAGFLLIGPTEALDALRAQLPEDRPIQVFTDYQVREAVEFIATEKPAVVAIEEGFAVSPRGEALIGRIMDDPALKACEIRVVAGPARPVRPRQRSGTGITPAKASVPAAAQAPAIARPAVETDTVEPRPLDRRGTRRAERIPIIEGVVVTVDGSPAELVDLSVMGAQVISRIVLRPNQRVRVQLPENKADGRRPLRCSASVVWASFEMPAGQPPRYRAGLKLSGGEADAIHHFAVLHRVPMGDDAE
jgi:hypothetical protein